MSDPTSEPRWLDPDELDAWMGLVRVLTLLPAALDRQLRAEAGLPHAHYQVLATLSDAPGGACRMSDLARTTATSQSRLSHAVSAMEAKGWVRRRPCPDDGRGQLAELTDEGRALLVRTAPGHVAEVRRLVFDQLSPAQVAQLRELTRAIGDALPE
jgi:DNA-binding MarR family transcriptional regulator